MEDANQLIHTLVQQLAAVFARESDQILQEQLGIGYSQFKILSTLANNPVAQQKYIAFELGQTEASISRQIKLLHGKGMLTSRVNPANMREHVTELSAKGRRLTTAAQTVLKNYQHDSLQHLPAKQQVQLLELLSKAHA